MKKQKFLFIVVSLVLVCLICTLSPIEASEYVHCHHIDVCEFLELSGELSETQKTRIIIELISKIAYQFPTGRNKSSFCFSPWIEGLFTNVASVPKFPLSVSFYIFSKHVKSNPIKTLYSPFDEKGSKILIDNKENISHLAGSCLPFQALQIINISIIRSWNLLP